MTIAAYNVLEIKSPDDLTGTKVYTADGKPFSFFSGNIRTRYPVDQASRDHLVEQLPSVDVWGKSFSVVPTPRKFV